MTRAGAMAAARSARANILDPGPVRCGMIGRQEPPKTP
jgi:hypothetical protein